MLETFVPCFYLPLPTLLCLVNVANMVFNVKNKCSQALALPVGQKVRLDQVKILTDLYIGLRQKWKIWKAVLSSAFLVPLRKYCNFCGGVLLLSWVLFGVFLSFVCFWFLCLFVGLCFVWCFVLFFPSIYCVLSLLHLCRRAQNNRKRLSIMKSSGNIMILLWVAYDHILSYFRTSDAFLLQTKRKIYLSLA